MDQTESHDLLAHWPRVKATVVIKPSVIMLTQEWPVSGGKSLDAVG